MKKLLLLVFIFLPYIPKCQLSIYSAPDSLMKINRVKKVIITSVLKRGNGRGEMIYLYNKNGDIMKYYSVNPISNTPYIITDYSLTTPVKAMHLSRMGEQSITAIALQHQVFQ